MFSNLFASLCYTNRQIAAIATAVLLCLYSPDYLYSQATANDSSTNTGRSSSSKIAGQILRPSIDSTEPVAGQWVTLHRVAKGNAGPVDSVRTDKNGRYLISFVKSSDPEAIYFAAAMYKGIAYFSSPLGANESDTGYDLIVFDTTGRHIDIVVKGRHIVVSSPDDDGYRRVTEVFELGNDSSVTRVAFGDHDSSAVWSTLVPAGAVDPELLEGDLSKEAIRFSEGKLLVFAPVAPGFKQVAFTYRVHDSALPLSFPIESTVSVLEVLIENGSAVSNGAKLEQVAPVNLQGEQFVRYLATDSPKNGVVTISHAPRERRISPTSMVIITLLVGGGMVGALTWAMRKKKPSA